MHNFGDTRDPLAEIDLSAWGWIDRCEDLVDTELLTKFSEFLVGKLSVIIRDKYFGHAISANDILPKKLLDIFYRDNG